MIVLSSGGVRRHIRPGQLRERVLPFLMRGVNIAAGDGERLVVRQVAGNFRTGMAGNLRIERMAQDVKTCGQS